MAKALTLTERLEKRLADAGLTLRKSKELAKGLAVSFTKPVKGKISVKLTDRLMKLGMVERKAKELAKKLVPTVNAALKAKAAAKTAKAHPHKAAPISDEEINEAIAGVTDNAEDAELDKVAPRVNGHRLRLDMPVLPYTGARGVEILRVMHGYTTTATYLVAAVKGPEGIVAIRKLYTNQYNVKFYPNFAHWGRTQTDLARLGMHDYLNRGPYERMHANATVTGALLDLLAKEAKPRKGIRGLMDRLKAITFTPLEKAFTLLYSRSRSSSAA